MSAATLVGRDLYLRHTDTNGRSNVQLHRVWDVERFLAARQSDAQRLNAGVKDKDAARPACVEVVDRAAYMSARAA
jgi:hypothetical protein